MLYLVGLGLYDHKDISERGLDVIRNCEKVYIELYTNPWKGNVEELKKVCGKEVSELVRKDMEEDSKVLVKEAKSKDIAVLVPGDPLVATTHSSLLQEANAAGVESRVVHSSSIYSAIAETGLHIYKFGKTATIALPEKNYFPKTPYKVLQENLEIGAHTLFLLDVKGEKKRYMTINEGIVVLLELEERIGKNIFDRNTPCVGCARLGSEDSIIKFGKAQDLKDHEFGDAPHIIIVPSKLHFSEQEVLDSF